MGSLFRSQEMSLCQLYLQTESAYAAISELGELGVIQFKDLNEDINVFQRKFVNEVRRCEEMERQLRYFDREVNADGISPEEYGPEPRAPGEQDLIDFEATFESLESQLKEIANNIDALGRNYYELIEMRHVLKLSREILFQDAELMRDPSNDLTVGIEMSDVVGIVDSPRVKLEFITGVIHLERMEPFMRMLWLACRGMTYVRHTEIPEDIHDLTLAADVRKVVFTVFFQGEQLRTRVKKICDGFRAMVYPCPPSSTDRQEMLEGVNTRIQDLELVIQQSQDQRRRVLESISKNLSGWTVKIFKVKAIYHTLNLLRAEYQSFIGEGWCPTDQIPIIQEALTRATEQSRSTAPSLINRMECTEKPTYHRTNKFTQAYQSIIDAYGIATYREVNPALFTITTFPFLFSVMFGDAGHGLIMALFAGWMLLKERAYQKIKTDNEIWNILFGGRYLIFSMGLFSIYSGFIYNDFFSKSLNIFGSSWSVVYSNTTLFDNETKTLQLDPNDTSVFSGSAYPFGLDPVWQTSSNKITYTNSYKKKISVIFGVCQMVFGVFLSLANQIHQRKWIDVFTEFIPQMLFLLSIFGYLVVQVFVKWVMFTPAMSICAPSLLIGLINMVMFKNPGPEEPCAIQMWYTGQFAVQIFLVLLAAICVPWMLLIKPFYLRWRHKRTKKIVYMVDMDPGGEMFGETSTDHTDTEILTERSSSVAAPMTKTAPLEEEPFDFGELLIHQMIHTIEFCLGCISHTASYLRLWALSLAHAQLSEVLWTMVFRIGFKMKGFSGFLMLAIVFVPWAFLTVAILLLMEGLSAFLHTLRLHWVEFQSKFYKGEGFPFEPFDLKKIIDNINY